jgi:hypothetical protein
MGREIVIKLSQLADHTLTRTRGAEAADALRSAAAAGQASRVYLEMAADTLVTASFVDELVRQAAEMECAGGPEVVFVVDDPEMLQKFQKSVTWRQLQCRYRRPGDEAIRTLQPAS